MRKICPPQGPKLAQKLRANAKFAKNRDFVRKGQIRAKIAPRKIAIFFRDWLFYDSLNLIISGVHQSQMDSWGHRSEKVKLTGLDCDAYKMCQCAVLLKDKIIIWNVFGSY